MKLNLLKNNSLLVTIVTLINFFTLINATILAIDYGKGFTKNSIIGIKNPLDIVLSQDSKRKDVAGIMLRPENKNKDIERSYGSNILNFQLRFPQYVFLGLKNLIGQKQTSDIFDDFNSGVKLDSKNDLIKFDIGTDHKFSVEELVAMDFNHIIANAEQQFPNNKKILLNSVNNEISDLVLSVPNYYRQQERLMLSDIVEISDFDQSLGFVDDNLATGISYIAKNNFKLEDDVDTHFIVYDMGQESLKASLFTVLKNSSAILAKDEIVDLTIELNGYGYDKNLGGDFFTNNLKTFIINKFLDKNGKYKKNELLKNSKFLNKIIQVAEKCKLVLSANSEYKIFVESLIDDLDFKTIVTRQEFEDIIMANYQARILKPLVDTFETSNSIFQNDNNITLANISAIILTGGSTRVPFVQQVLVDYLGEEYDQLLSKSVNSDESVTTGLAIRGVKLENNFKFKQNINVVDKLIYNYTMTLNEDDEETSIFSAGSVYPGKQVLNFPIEQFDNQKEVNIILSEDNVSIVDYKLKLNTIKKCETDDSSLNITFAISKDRIFTVEKIQAICNNTATKLNTLTIDKYFVKEPLSKTDIRNSKKFIKLLNEKDEQKIILTEALNLFESTLYETRSFLEDIETEDIPEELIETLQTAVADYLEWLDYDSDGCTVQDVEKKHLDITHQIQNIKNYQISLTTSLDLDEFNNIFETITNWLDDLETLNALHLEHVLNKTEKFEELNITGSPLDVYIETPLTKRLAMQNKTFFEEVTELKEKFVPRLTTLLENFEEEERLDKFELKLQYLNHLEQIKELLQFPEELFKYRLRYLDSTIVKKERQLLRQAEKARLEKVKELGLKDKDGNLVEDIMENTHKRAEAREKLEEEEFLKNTEGYEPKDDDEEEEEEEEEKKIIKKKEEQIVEKEENDENNDEIEFEFDEL
ncbi:actin-like ATPase domain-containing protein [Hanseniaspora valbyensis NRRL Y-1626]|uniref:Actin-like ATPase domain-containing protein n=1 Tax=Hanseniaspora valbyensis NRRL Y-1626 TaxID=766949 RepID=A0A1B7TJM7_9ASCO|nr:actin-like ATPase domain-containing protein [Hanseniaspora valbyensis NRRL Y-1626]